MVYDQSSRSNLKSKMHQLHDSYMSSARAAFLLRSKPMSLGIPGMGEVSLLPEGLFLKPPKHSERCPVADIDRALFGPMEARRPFRDGFLIPYNAILNVSIFRPFGVGVKYLRISYLDRRGEEREISFSPVKGSLIPRSLTESWLNEIVKRASEGK